MCWELESNRKRIVKIKTATHDIPVFKILNRDYSAKYRTSNYYNELKTYRAKNSKGNTIRTLKIKYIKYQTLLKECYGYSAKIYVGLHSYNSFGVDTNYYEDDADIVVEFVIPKGTKYVFNPDKGEYVSLQLRRIE